MNYIIIIFFSLSLYGCSFAPTYHRPVTNIPVKYKEQQSSHQAKSQRLITLQEPWWNQYHDPVLNSLEEKVSLENQDLKIAFTHYEQANAELAATQASYYPTLLGVANAYRQQISGNVANKSNISPYSDILLGLNLHYELDVWGRIRNSVVSAKRVAQASAADLAMVNLSLHAEMANTYFMLRGIDASQHVVNKMVAMYQRAFYLTQHRYKGGAASISDVEQAKNQLDTAKTIATDTHLKRAQLEHAIAVLIGQAPSTFNLKIATNSPLTNVTIAPDLPSTLLKRRPDIVEAELLVQSANANIGVARAAFFPSFNLSLGGGVESETLTHLLSMPSLAWSLGPTTASALLNNGSMPLITQTLLDGGKIKALSYEAEAKYRESAAKYRKTVLNAFQEVEDQLAAIRELDQQNKFQTAASHSANRALTQAMYRYKAGLTTYLDVVVTQNTFLQSELATINIHTRRQVASVQLIKALGGGWHQCA